MKQSSLDALKKKYDMNVFTLSGGDRQVEDVDVIPSGIPSFDIITGIGGIPRGKFTQIFSNEGVGKTTFCLQLIASAQRMGLETMFIDMENRLDPKWAATLGVDLEKMYFVQPPYGEAALNTTRIMSREGIGLIVIDSIPTLIPKKEIDGETGDEFVGLQARMIAQYFRQITPEMSKGNTAIVFTNQMRSVIGGAGSLAFGPRTTQPGGWAPKFYSSMIIEMKRIKTLKGTNDVATGHVVKTTIKKSSLSVPLRSAELILTFGVGFDKIEDIINIALKNGIIEQAGAWYSFGGEKFQGRANLYEAIKNVLYDPLYEQVLPVISPDSFGGDDED